MARHHCGTVTVIVVLAVVSLVCQVHEVTQQQQQQQQVQTRDRILSSAAPYWTASVKRFSNHRNDIDPTIHIPNTAIATPGSNDDDTQLMTAWDHISDWK